jgi:hypothetical protein
MEYLLFGVAVIGCVFFTAYYLALKTLHWMHRTLNKVFK